MLLYVGLYISVKNETGSSGEAGCALQELL